METERQRESKIAKYPERIERILIAHGVKDKNNREKGRNRDRETDRE